MVKRLSSPSAASRRSAWALGDEMLSSLTNFLASAMAARAVSPSSFGAYSLALITVFIVLQVIRSFTSCPVVVLFSAEEGWTDDARAAATASLGLGALAGLAFVGAGLILPGTVGNGLIAIGPFVPLLMLGDYCRFLFVAERRPQLAVLVDLVWLLGLVGVAVWLNATGSAHYPSYLLAWSVTGAVAAILGAIMSRFRPAWRGAGTWLVKTRTLGGTYLADYVGGSGGSQLTVYILGAVVGVEGVAALRGAEILVGPIYVLVQGMVLALIPEAVRATKGNPGAVRPIALRASALQIAMIVMFGAVILSIPSSVGSAIFGDSWAVARTVLVPTLVSTLFLGISIGAIVGLRALVANREMLAARSIGLPLSIAGGVIGVLVDGARGAAIGLAMARALQAPCWWVALHIAVRDREALAFDATALDDVTRRPSGPREVDDERALLTASATVPDGYGRESRPQISMSQIGPNHE